MVCGKFKSNIVTKSGNDERNFIDHQESLSDKSVQVMSRTDLHSRSKNNGKIYQFIGIINNSFNSFIHYMVQLSNEPTILTFYTYTHV